MAHCCNHYFDGYCPYCGQQFYRPRPVQVWPWVVWPHVPPVRYVPAPRRPWLDRLDLTR